MAKKKARSKLAAGGGGLAGALQAHSGDETRYGLEIIDLPPGIKNGVATLVDANLDVYKPGTKYAGQQRLYLGGVVVSPEEVVYAKRFFAQGKVQVAPPETVKIVGQRTSVILPLCDTTNASGEVTELDENVDNALNELRKLGFDTNDIGSEEALTASLEALVEAGPRFRFGTSASTPSEQYPEERAWQRWFGTQGMEDEDEDADDGVEDDGEEEDDAPEDADAEPEDADLDALGAAADEGEEEAVVKLTELCDDAGIDPNDVATWTEVAAQLATGDESEEEGNAEEEGEEPGVDEVWSFKPKRARSLKEGTVVTVNKAKKTVTWKDLETDKVHKDVPWDALVDED